MYLRVESNWVVIIDYENGVSIIYLLSSETPVSGIRCRVESVDARTNRNERREFPTFT